MRNGRTQDFNAIYGKQDLMYRPAFMASKTIAVGNLLSTEASTVGRSSVIPVDMKFKVQCTSRTYSYLHISKLEICQWRNL